MAVKIKPLRKFTTGTPTTSDMVEGEIAVNTADKKVFMRDNANNIIEVGAASSLSLPISGGTLTNQLTTPSIRITDTTDASLSSTGHGLQVGPTSGLNVIMDGNEIMARNNSAVSSLHFQHEGGSFEVGAAANNSSGINLYGPIMAMDGNLTLPSFAAATNEGALQVFTSEIDSTNLWDDINSNGNNYSSMPSEISVSNLGNNTTNSFAGIFMMAGETSNNNSVNAARIGAIREGAGKQTAIGFAVRQNGGDMVEVGRFKSTKQFNISGDIELEGSSYITTLTKTAPTAARTITFPDVTGTVMVQDSSGVMHGSQADGSLHLTGNNPKIVMTDTDSDASVLQFYNDGGVNSDDQFFIDVDNGDDVDDSKLSIKVDGTNIATFDTTGAYLLAGINLIFEGATANSNETTLTVTDPTADRTITLPDATGTVALTSQIPTVPTNASVHLKPHFVKVSSEDSDAAAVRYIKVATINSSTPTNSNSTFVFRILLEGRASFDGASQFRVHIRTGDSAAHSSVVVEQEHSNRHTYYGIDSFIFFWNSQNNSEFWVKIPNNANTAYQQLFAKLEVSAPEDTEFVSGHDDVTIHTSQSWTTSAPTGTNEITAEWIKKRFDSIIFEGSTTDTSETFLQAADPTADRTITLPDATGQVVLSDGAIDTDASAEIGRAHVGHVGWNDYAGFSHVDQNAQTTYALLHGDDGKTYLNAATGQTISQRINNVEVLSVASTGITITGTTDLNGGELILDADADSSIHASTDDIIDFKIAGNDVFKLSNSTASIRATPGDVNNSAGLKLERNDTTPSDGDLCGYIFATGHDSGGSTSQSYARMDFTAEIVTANSERGSILFKLIEGSGGYADYFKSDSNLGQNIFYKDIKADTGVDIIFEGATANANETTLTVTDPTQDNTITLPDATGTVMLNVVEDTSPQLGGNLDINGKDIVSTSNGNIDIKPNGSGYVKLETTTGTTMIKSNTGDQDTDIESTGLYLNNNSTTAGSSVAIGLHPGTDTSSSVNLFSWIRTTRESNSSANLTINVANDTGSSSWFQTKFGGNTDSGEVMFPKKISLGNADTYQTTLENNGSISADRTITFPDATGTVHTTANPEINGAYGSTSAPRIFKVTVATKTAAHPYNGDGSNSGFVIDGIMGPALTLHGADNMTSNSQYIYRFDQADGTNATHPLRFYLDAAKTYAYTTGVTTNGTPGQAGAYTQIAVTQDTPQILYYQCSSHNYMGNYVIIPHSTNIKQNQGNITLDAIGGNIALTQNTGNMVFTNTGSNADITFTTNGSGVLKHNTNTVLTLGNSDAPTTTTSDGDADFVLIDDGGTMKKITPANLGIGSGGGGVTVQDEGSALSTTGTTLNFVGAGVVASGTGATKTITISGGGSGITVQDEGSDLSTAGTTLNFVGAGVTASGTGSTKTITISGGGGGSGISTGKSIAMAMVFG